MLPVRATFRCDALFCPAKDYNRALYLSNRFHAITVMPKCHSELKAIGLRLVPLQPYQSHTQNQTVFAWGSTMNKSPLCHRSEELPRSLATYKVWLELNKRTNSSSPL